MRFTPIGLTGGAVGGAMPPLVYLWLAACAPGDSKGGPDPVETAGSGVDSGSTVPAEETCDGVDNDGDGRVDEGFADQDADGLADCLDRTCTPVVASVTWGALPECEGEVVDPYMLDRRWEAAREEPTNGVAIAPVAGWFEGTAEVMIEATDEFWGASVLAGADGAWRWSVDAYQAAEKPAAGIDFGTGP